ncbi:MAG: glycerol-3-phosphate O-acyltransferase/dihydroxyacetone phosphate acyltransferase [Saprospiraceae bacterium]|jgi:glycerol-3-phosphate O-acyltransferase/dihydroxyacetone phosphate acyltransferase
MIYHTLLIIFRFALRLYFRKIKVNFEAKLPMDKPILFVSNHQSSFMDAILIGTLTKCPLQFMSRGESFNTPLKRWIFKQFNMNPIYRKEHSPELLSKNSALIEGFQRLLLNKHSILIFPEGISHVESRIYPIKSGAARVILGAQATSAHEILLVPIGLNYENPHRFHSEVLVNVGQSVEMEEYNQLYKKDERRAVRLLTERIKFELDRLTLNVTNEDLENLFPVIQSLYETELIEQSPIALSKDKKTFRIRKDIIAGMHFITEKFPDRAKRIRESLCDYQQLLRQYNINDKWLSTEFQKSSRQWSGRNILFYLAGLPISIYGLITHLWIIKLPPLMVEKIIKRPDFKGSLLLSFGVLCFVLFYILQISLFAWIMASFFWTLIFSLSLPLSGAFLLRYIRKFWQDKDILEFKAYLKNDWQMLEHLNENRQQLLHQLRLARQDYMAFAG